jgi:hypothetical protein
MEVLALMLELMLASVELFAGLACAAASPPNAASSKSQVINSHKLCLMAVIWV